MEVTLLVQESLPIWRRNIGWIDPDFGQALVVTQPDPGLVGRLCAHTTSNDVHLFSGIRSYPMVWEAFRRVAKTPARVGILSEASNWLGWSGRVRIWRANLDAARLRTRIDFILAISQLGVRWFTKSGYDPAKIFPFAYFTEMPAAWSTPKLSELTTSDETIRLIFIGQCIKRKGVDLLIEALAELQDLPWVLTIVGDGADRLNIEKRTVLHGLQARVHFLGSKANSDAMRLLETSDLLLLPSRWDGWGAVINEALMRGVPVVASDFCGASDLLRENERGDIFPSGVEAELRTVLAKRMFAGKNTEATAQRIKAWTHAISGEAAANYLIDVVETVIGNTSRPTPPWLVQDNPPFQARLPKDQRDYAHRS